MNIGLTLLNELEYVRAPMLSSVVKQTSIAPTLSRAMSVSGSQRTIQLRSPYFIRALAAADVGAAWAPLCSALRRHDIPIFSSAESLAGVPAASVPTRWSGRPVDEPFLSIELTTADLFEVSCLSRDRRQWRWPSEIAVERIDGLLRSARAVAGNGTPVGLNVPLGCHPHDLQRCLAADIDFISLSCTPTATHSTPTATHSTPTATHSTPAVAHSTPAVAHRAGSQWSRTAASVAAASAFQSGDFSAGDLHSIVLCRQMSQRLNRPQLPLLVTAPVVDIEQAHKLLALGATAVSIDQVVWQSIVPDIQPSQEEESERDLPFRLPSIPQSVDLAAKKAELPQLEIQLQQARQGLLERLQIVGASSLADFTLQCLVSASQRAQQVTGVRRLEL